MSTKRLHDGYFKFVPHSIEDRAYWEGIKEDPRHRWLLEEVQRAAAEAPEQLVCPSASDYLAAKRSNNRRVIDTHWQGDRRTLSLLALNRCLQGLDDQDADDRLLNWLWALLTESTWTVSAHLPNNDLPAFRETTLDLASCGMARLLAEITEVLKPWMDSVSETLAGRVQSEIQARVLEPYGQGQAVWWHNLNAETTNNWSGVCAGTILAACESLAIQGHANESARTRALKGLQFYLEKGFTERGECDEGVAYWAYGVSCACMGWGRLEKDDAQQWIDVERLFSISDYPWRAHLFGNTFYSGNDGGLVANAGREFVPWLAEALDHDGLRQWVSKSPGLSAGDFSGMIRALDVPQKFLVAPEKTGSVTVRRTPEFLEDQQVALLRTQTSKAEMVAILTGGHNKERHNHNDLGHFLILHQEKVIVPDLGAPRYKADFFGPNRYTYLAASSRGHCCPEINGHEQRPGQEAKGKVLSWNPDAEIPRLVLDLTSAYPEEAGLAGWTRSLECWPASPEEKKPARMVLTDVFRTHQPQQRIEHVIWTCFKPVNVDERLDFAGIRFLFDSVICDISPSPMAIGVEEVDADALELKSWLKQKFYRLSAVYKTDEEGKLQVQTTFFA